MTTPTQFTDAESRNATEHELEKQASNAGTPEPEHGSMSKAPTTNPPIEFDEYGTELHKDARVWKVYVNETDKYDMELAKEWNDSTEVILSSALLSDFYCVIQSQYFAQNPALTPIFTFARFLIESSKLLSEDPVEVSKQTLVIMSQTLLNIANGTPVPGFMAASPLMETDNAFVPSYLAVCVNVLWFLSLSLSLATSFIAMMAKDWTHSFISGRTGHPFSQACRRQQKWDMIDSWRMRDLLSVLPSLMHTALLLFAVGLGIYLWDVHIAVAVPVICVTGVSVGFYIITSIGAIVLDYFPYPTIISRLCRGSNIARQFYGYACLLTSSAVSWLPLWAVVAVACHCLALAIGVTVLCVELVDLLLFVPFSRMIPHLDLGDQYILVDGDVTFRWIAHFPLTLVRLLVCYPADTMHRWISYLTDFGVSSMDQVQRFPGPLLFQGNTITESVRQRNSHASGHCDLLGRALGWLIVNCEVPQSVDIALQAIAGGENVISPQPLLDCNATLAILQRLASSNLHRDPSAHASTVVSLYARALAFLGNAVGSGPESAKQRGEDTLEGLVWNLHSETERSVAALIANGDFKPTKSNIDALRIGSTAASTSLKILDSGSQIDIDTALASIDELLILHFNGKETLHNAVLQSLLNAAGLLCLVAKKSPKKCSIPWICVRLAESYHGGPAPHMSPILGTAITWMLWSSTSTDQTRQVLDNRTWSKAAIRGLIDMHSSDGVGQMMISAFGLHAIFICKEPPHVENRLDQIMRQAALKHAALNLNTFYDGIQKAIPRNDLAPYREDEIMSYLRAFCSTYDSLSIGAALSCIPFFAIPVMHGISYQILLSNTLLANTYEQKMKTCRFPTMTRTLLWVLEERNVHDELVKLKGSDENAKRPSIKTAATGQLWLLVTLFLGRSWRMTKRRDRQGAPLNRNNRNNLQSGLKRQKVLGEELEQLWNALPWDTPSEHMIWPARVLECVYQSQNSPLPKEVHRYLHDVPPEVRGLSSFTSWRPGLEDITTEEVTGEIQADEAHTSTAILPRTDTQSGTEDNNSRPAFEIAGREIEIEEAKEPAETGGDGGGMGEGDGIENHATELTNAKQEVASEDIAAALAGQEGNEGSQAGEGGGGCDDMKTGVAHEPHVTLDMDKTEQVLE